MECEAIYREFAPGADLRGHVRAFFTFTAPADTRAAGPAVSRAIIREVAFPAGQTFTPLFADAHLSIVVTFGAGYRVAGLWDGRSAGHVIGAMSSAHAVAHGDRIVQVGAYVRAVKVRALMGFAAHEFTDRIVPLEDVWGSEHAALECRMYEAESDGARVQILEEALRNHLRGSEETSGRVDVAGLTQWMIAQRGCVTVGQLAAAAGVSRQHLTRVFREEVGLSPKLYARLTRFRAGLGMGMLGAGSAAALGYADQSHMIAEFREFSGLTPGMLAAGRRFHPFI
ncbi:MAG: AraC family transcriptional regulator [Acidobacteriota bacterium]